MRFMPKHTTQLKMGHKKKAPNGYIHVYCPNHPNAKGGGYMLEHRLVVEASIGRFLRRGEVVHHINEIKDDNRIENLQLCSSDQQHKRIHRPFQPCETCGEIHNPGEHKRTHCSKCGKVIRLGGRNHMPPVCWGCKFPEKHCEICGKITKPNGGNGFCAKHNRYWYDYKKDGMTRDAFIAKFKKIEASKVH